MGILSCVNPQTTSLAWAESILCIVWLGVYSMSVGPIVYTIVAEIGSTRLRTQTVVLGRSMYYFTNLIGGIMEPYFMSPTAWNAKGKTVCFYILIFCCPLGSGNPASTRPLSPLVTHYPRSSALYT